MFLATQTSKKTMPQMMNSYQEQSLIQVLSPEALLANAGSQKSLKEIETLVDIPADYYHDTYSGLIHRFADFVQVLPAVEGGQLGGLLEEGLARALLAIKLQLAESQEEEPLFTFAVFSAALTIDLRKLYANKKIMISDVNGVFRSEWSPFEASLGELASYYKIREYHRPITQLSPYLTLLLAREIMPEAAFLWLSEDFRLLNMWMAALCGDEEGAGGVGHFLNLAKRKLLQVENKPRLVVPVEITQPREIETGEAFWAWLKKVALESEINKPDSSIHVVEEGIFLEVPKIFQDFCVQAKLPDWRVPYQQFVKLGIAATNQQEGDLNDPEQLFIYLNKEEMDLDNKQKKTSQTKKLTGNFFGENIDKQAANVKEYEQIQTTYHKQRGLVAERDWFFRTSKKLIINKRLKAFMAKEKLAKKFRALRIFKAKRAAAALRHRMSSRFK